MPGDPLCHRDRAGVGEIAIVEARAGDDVGDQADIGGREASAPKRLPEQEKIGLAYMREYQVLLMGDPNLSLGVTVGEIGDDFHRGNDVGYHGVIGDGFHDGFFFPCIYE